MSISDKHVDEIVTHRLECKPPIESLKAALTTAEAQRDALAEALRKCDCSCVWCQGYTCPRCAALLAMPREVKP